MRQQQDNSGPDAKVSRDNWIAYGALLFSTFVMIEAMTFQAPALPTIVRHFGVPMNAAGLIILIFFIGSTTFAPIMGRIADSHGRKKILMAGLVIFSISEFVAAFSPTFTVLLIARFAQGFGVACIIPVVMAYIGYLFSESKRGLALGIFTGAMSFGAATGALAGGLLVDSFGWPIIYWLSGVLGVMGLGMVTFLVPDIPSERKQKGYDLAGTALLLLTVAGLLSVPTSASRLGLLSPWTITALIVGICAAALLWQIERRAKDPIIDMNILCNRHFILPGGIYLLNVMCLAGLTYSLAFFINGRPGGNASQVGFINMCLYGCSMLAAPLAGRLADRIEPRTIIAGSIIIVLLGMLAMSNIGLSTPLWAISGIVIVIGLANGTNTPPLLKLIVGAVPRERLAQGTGLFSMLKDFGAPAGATFGLAVFGGAVMMLTQKAVTSTVQKAGAGPELLSVVAGMARSSAIPENATAIAQLEALGIDIADTLATSQLIGMGTALPWVTYILAFILCLIFLMTLRLPRCHAGKATSNLDSRTAVVKTT
ncbi:MFS transporter [Pseudomonas sp. WN033]|nr:MFS transporter [Pseudomonas sp. WN033]